MATDKKNDYSKIVENMQNEPATEEVVAESVSVTPKSNYTSDYAGWLRAQQDNYKADNTPTGAKSFGQFLKENYGDVAGQYGSTVKDIESGYKRSLATYGQMAENLGKAGLTRSGYSDYLSGNAYTAAQQQKAAARLYADQSMKDAKMKYSEYLTGLEQQQNEQAQQQLAGAIDTISSWISKGYSIDTAKAALKGLVPDDVIEQAAANLSGAYTEATKATEEAQKAADTEQAAKLTSGISDAMNEGSSINTIRDNLKQQGYSDEDINEALKNSIINIANTAKDKVNVNTGLVGVEYDALTTLGADEKTLKELGLDETLVTDLTNHAKNHNNDILLYALGIDTAAGLPKDETGSKRAAAMKSVREFYEENGVAATLGKESTEDGDILMDVALYMMDKNLIDTTRGQNFVNAAMGNTISEDRNNPTDEINNMDKLYQLYDRGDGALTEEQYMDRLAQIGRDIGEAFGVVSDAKAHPTTDLNYAHVNEDMKVSISYKQGDDRKRGIDIIPTNIGLKVSDGGKDYQSVADSFIDGKSVDAGAGKEARTYTFGTVDGKIAIKETYRGKTYYYYASNDNIRGFLPSDPNKAFMAYMCSPSSYQG